MHNLFTQDGVQLITEEIKEQVNSFYIGLLGTHAIADLAVDLAIVNQDPVLTQEQRIKLVVPVTRMEIVKALWSIGDTKAPGADGFSAKFFKHSWSVVTLLVL